MNCKEIYLTRLGKKLLYYFPLEQVEEILEDYQGHFSLGQERGSTDADMIAALGTPDTVTKEILREMPEGRRYFVRHTVRWGILLLLACCCLYLRRSFYESVVLFGSYSFLIIGALSAFALLHGRGQAAIEGRFQQSPAQPAAAYLFPLVMIAIIEGLTQYFASVGARLPNFLTASQVGALFSVLFETARYIFPLLLVWILWRIYKDSIRRFPAAVCTLGAILFIQEIERILHSTKVDYEPEQLNLMLAGCLLPYGVSALMALLFWRYISRKGH